MTNKKFSRIILYGDREKQSKLQELLSGVPVSVWYRAKVDEALESGKKPKL